MSRRLKPWIKRTRLILESLESRTLLSGLHGAASAHAANHYRAIVSTLETPSVKTTAGVAGQQSETHLVATLADPAGVSKVTGTARFESDTERGVVASELSVMVKGMTPGTTIDVMIADATGNSVTVGHIIANADGSGQLKLKSNVPTVTADSVISLSTTDVAGTTTLLASGTFAAPTGKPGGSHDHAREQNETHLVASLADPSSKLTGVAHYEDETEHGLSESELTVLLKGAAPGAVIDVSLAADATSPGVSIGKITIGADGSGRLKLNSGLPPVTSTSVLTLSVVTTAPGGTTTTTSITSATFAVPTAATRRAAH